MMTWGHVELLRVFFFTRQILDSPPNMSPRSGAWVLLESTPSPRNIPPPLLTNLYVRPTQNLLLSTRIYPLCQQLYAILPESTPPSRNIPLLFNNYMRPSGITYGINCINISAGDFEKMEKIQSRLLKAGIGIHKFCRSSPFLEALNVSKIDNVIETSSLKLISAIFSNSRAKTFYCYLLKKHCCDKLRNHTDLIARVRAICSKHNVSLFKYILDTSYAHSVQVSIKLFTTPEDGLCDSVRQVLLSRNPYDQYILSLLLKSF